ncbi:carboxypeptidase regulatory-like domain-containing protein [Chloroflexota bacterium]
MSRRLRWGFGLLLGLGLLGLIWLGMSTDPTITALRNTLHFKAVKQLGGPQVRSGEPGGDITGAVRDTGGDPVSGAVVLVASPIGHAYSAETDHNGYYEISGVPPGRYLPVAGKRGYDEAVSQRCVAGLCQKRAVDVRPGAASHDVDISVEHAESLSIAVDNSLVISPTEEVEVGAPFPSRAWRTHFSFERAGRRLDACYLYEPLDDHEPLPTLLLVLPGPVLNWEIVPVPFAAEGFSVLACYPLRGIDIDEDVADILTALEYLWQGRLTPRADPERLGLLAASFTSIHTYRLLGMTDQVDVALVLGGMSDGFAFRHDLETGVAHTRPPFDQLNMALGFPNTSPQQFFKYSVLYHLEGLPPLCLLHGVEDELSPFSQSVQLAEELERRGHPHEFYSYEGLSHYFSTDADNATTQQMMQDSVDCLRRWLESK